MSVLACPRTRDLFVNELQEVNKAFGVQQHLDMEIVVVTGLGRRVLFIYRFTLIQLKCSCTTGPCPISNCNNFFGHPSFGLILMGQAFHIVILVVDPSQKVLTADSFHVIFVLCTFQPSLCSTSICVLCVDCACLSYGCSINVAVTARSDCQIDTVAFVPVLSSLLLKVQVSLICLCNH